MAIVFADGKETSYLFGLHTKIKTETVNFNLDVNE